MAQHRHRRETPPRRLPRAALAAGSLATLATAATVSVGVLAADPVGALGADLDADLGAAAARVPAPRPGTSELPERLPVVSRAAPRGSGPAIERVTRADRMLTAGATRRAVSAAASRLWTTAALNLWTDPTEAAELVGELDAAERVLVTGRSLYGREEVVVDGASRWVTAGYLSEDEPVEEPVGASAGLSMEPCPDSSVESGLTSNAVYVYRSVCNAFPQITSYGGWDGDGEHASGRAIDIMTSDVALGTAIAEFLRANAAELRIDNVIWRQQIWTPVRASEGWRYMPDRGSATANHYDHVHVATY